MAHSKKIEVLPPAEEPEEMPLPSDPKAVFLGGLFFLALLAAAYVAREVIMPLTFAVVLALLLQPALRLLERLRLPRTLAALLLIFALLGTIVGLGTAVSGPARSWAGKLPEGIPRLQEKLSFVREPVNTLQRFLQQVEDFGGGRNQSQMRPHLRKAKPFWRSYSQGPGTLPAGFSRPCCFFSFFSCLAIFSYNASLRYCRASAASVR